MVRFLIFTLIFLYSFNISSEAITKQEQNIFNFVDLNKNKNISLDEINKLIKLIFQLIDLDRDGNISELEVMELKNIIESLS